MLQAARPALRLQQHPLLYLRLSQYPLPRELHLQELQLLERRLLEPPRQEFS